MWNYHDILFSRNRTIILPGDTRQTTRKLPDVSAKLEVWRLQQSDMVFGIKNSFSWIFDAVSCGKSCPRAKLFLLTYIEWRTVKFLPPAESWLVNSNFRRVSRMQRKADSTRVAQPIRMQQLCKYTCRIHLF